MNKNADQHFDSLANKFECNIYGTTKGKLRQAILLAQLTPFLSPEMQVLDIGAGTGVMAKALCEKGHRVTLVDASQAVLQLAQEKFNSTHDATFVHARLQELPTESPVDLLVCHAVLEWLDTPQQVLPILLKHIKPGGLLSLSFFNQQAFLFGNLLYGNFDYVQKGAKQANQVRLNPKQPLAPTTVMQWFDELPVELLFKGGVRCIHDYLKDKRHQHTQYQALQQLEIEYGQKEPYLWLGKYFHMILRLTE